MDISHKVDQESQGDGLGISLIVVTGDGGVGLGGFVISSIFEPVDNVRHDLGDVCSGVDAGVLWVISD